MKSAIRHKLHEALKVNFKVDEVLKQAPANSNLSKFEFKDLTLEQLKLTGMNFRNTRFTNVRFEKTDLDGCDFSNSVFDNCVFHENIVKNTCFDSAQLKNTKYMFSTLSNCSFFKTTMEKNRFAKTTIEYCNFEQVQMSQNRFELTDILNTGIQELESSKTVISKVNIHNGAFLFNSFDGMEISQTKITDTSWRYSLFTHNTWENAEFENCDFSFAKGLEDQQLEILAKGQNKLSSFGPGALFSGKTAKISVPVLVAVCCFVVWNLLFNYSWQSTPTLINLAEQYIQEGRYEKVSAPVSVLLKRNENLPPELLDQISRIGLDNLALILSTTALKHKIDVNAIILSKIIASELEFKRDDRQKAITTGIQALAMTKDKAIKHRILLNLADWYKQTNQNDKMLAALDQASTLDLPVNDKAEATLKKAKLIAPQKPEKAIELYKKGIALCTSAEQANEAKIQLAAIYTSQGDSAKAQKLLNEILDSNKNPTTPTALESANAARLALAFDLISDNQQNKAKPLLEAVIKNNSSSPKTKSQALGLQASMFIGIDDEQATKNLTEALSIAPNPTIRARIYTKFAHTLFDNNQIEKALEIIQKALSDNADATEAKVLQGTIYASKGQHETAITLFEQVLKEPDILQIKSWLTTELLKSYTTLGMNEQIIAMAPQLENITAARNNTQAESLAILAQAQADQGQTQKAILNFEKAAKGAKAEGLKNRIFSSLAKLYIDSGNPQKALPLLEYLTNDANTKYNDANTKDAIAEALGMQGQIAVKNHDADTAIKLFEQGLEKTNDSGIRGWLSLELVKQYAKKKMDEKTLPLADELIELAPFDDAVAEALAAKAQVFERRDDVVKAMEFYELGLEKAKDEGIKNWLKNEITRLKNQSTATGESTST